MVTTGRTLDADGQPIPGTGFELDPDSELAELLAQRTGALTSHPDQAVWSAPLPAPDDADSIRSVAVYEPGFDGPPEHYHEESTERFDVRAGEVTFRIDDRTERRTAGEMITVEPTERHTFTVGGDELCYVVVDISAPGRLRQVLPTLGGLLHDDEMDADSPLQAALIARRLAGNTVFTEHSPVLTRPLTAVLEPVARLRGYQGAYATYTQDGFWERHVEQPPH